MKRLLVIVFVFTLGILPSFAQGPGRLDSFREQVLPEYSRYFSRVDLTENGQLNLTATDAYTSLSQEAKNEIIMKIIEAWKDPVVKVQYGSKRELWGNSAESGNTLLLDAYDLNSRPVIKPAIAGARPNPWFFYIGGQMGGDSQHDINLALNMRLGFFMLMNRWDLATTFSGGISGNTASDNAGSGWTTVGLMSRVHFPIKKIRLSPNVGGEVSMSVYGTTPLSVTGSVVLGVSWFIGIGNLDMGVHIGNEVSGSIGYTMMLGQKSHR